MKYRPPRSLFRVHILVAAVAIACTMLLTGTASASTESVDGSVTTDSTATTTSVDSELVLDGIAEPAINGLGCTILETFDGETYALDFALEHRDTAKQFLTDGFPLGVPVRVYANPTNDLVYGCLIAEYVTVVDYTLL